MAVTAYKFPTATGEDYNQWTSPTNAFTADAFGTSGTGAGTRQDFYNFTLGLVSTNVPVGIEIETAIKGAFDTPQPLGIKFELSWDGGSTYTATAKQATYTGPAPGSVVYTLGGASDLWGRSWGFNDFSNGNFRLRIEEVTNSFNDILDMDYAKVRVYYNYALTLAATTVTAPILLKKITKTIQAVSSGVSGLSPRSLRVRTLAATETMTAAINRRITWMKTLAATAGSTPTMLAVKGIYRSLNSTVTGSAGLLRRSSILRTLPATVSFVTSITSLLKDMTTKPRATVKKIITWATSKRNKKPEIG